MVNEPAQPKQQNSTALVLLAILFAALAVAAVIYLIPGTDKAVPGAQDNGSTNTVGLQGFNTAILQSREYAALDASLLTRGLLPVVPPAGTGKANIFR